jgi:hypothetical protein
MASGPQGSQPSTQAATPTAPTRIKPKYNPCLLTVKSGGTLQGFVGDKTAFGLPHTSGVKLQMVLEVRASDVSRGGLYLTIRFPRSTTSPYTAYTNSLSPSDTLRLSLRFPPGSFTLVPFRALTRDDLPTDADKAAFDAVHAPELSLTRIKVKTREDGTLAEVPQIIGWPWPYSAADPFLAAIFHAGADLGSIRDLSLKNLTERDAYTLVLKGAPDELTKRWVDLQVTPLEARVFRFPKILHPVWDAADYDYSQQTSQWKSGAMDLKRQQGPFLYGPDTKPYVFDCWEDFANAVRLGGAFEYFFRFEQIRKLSLVAGIMFRPIMLRQGNEVRRFLLTRWTQAVEVRFKVSWDRLGC